MAEPDHRFTTPTPWDRQPALWVVTTLFATWSTISLVVRLWIRKKVRFAEIALLTAFAFACASWIALYVGLVDGAGVSPSHLKSSDYATAGRAIFARNILLILAKGAATCSQILFLDEIMSAKEHRLLCRVMAALCLATTMIACLVVSVSCTPRRALSTGPDASCEGSGVARWSAASVMFILQFLINFILPIVLFWKVRLSTARRLNVIAWFSGPPLIDIVPIAIAIWEYTANIHDGSSGTGLVGFLVALEASLCWDLIYPTIPCLRPTALSYATGGVKATQGGTSSGTRSYGMGISHGSRNNTGAYSSSKQLETDELPLRPISSRQGHHTSVGVGDEDGDTTQTTYANGGSKSIQIKQEVEISRY